MGLGRRVVAGVAASTVAGGALLVVAEVLLASRREYLSADTAPSIRGEFGRAFAPPLRLAVLGDSTAAGVGVSHVDDTVAGRLARVVADTGRFVTLDGLGVSGSRAADLATQVSRALVTKPDVAVILIGANDATHVTDLDGVRDDVRTAVERLHAAGVRVVVGSCPDMGAATAFLPPLRQLVAWQGRRVGRVTREAAVVAGAAAVDVGGETGAAFRGDPGRYLSTDEFHPSADGYALWADALAGEVRAAVQRQSVG